MRDGIFLTLIVLILIFQVIIFSRMGKPDAEGSPTDETSTLPTDLPPTDDSGNIGATEGSSQSTEAPTEQSLPTLYDWLKDNPPSIKVFIVELPLSSVETDAASTIATAAPSITATAVSPQVTEITPVLNNLYVVNFSKTDLVSESVNKNIQVEITVAPPDLKVDKIGCLVVNYGDESKENCEFDYEKPIIIDIPEIMFATLDDGTSDCPGFGSLENPYYTGVKSYDISINWVEDSGGDQVSLSPPIALELTSNLIMLAESVKSEAIKIGGLTATQCEAVLVYGLSLTDSSMVSVYSFRTKKEGEIKIDYLVSNEYIEWLKKSTQ